MPARPSISLRRALEDPALLGEVLPADTWGAWRALLLAAMGERLTDDEREHFTALTGRPQEPLERVSEMWAVIGRRGGKTRASAALAVFLAALRDYRDVTVPGERPVVLFLAQNQRQARVAFGYAAGIIDAHPLLRREVVGRTVDTLSLRNGVDLEVRAASFRGLRGLTLAAVVADETAYWSAEGTANPDAEVLNAIRPALATTGGPIIAISTPYSRSGVLWGAFRQHFGPDGDPAILVARAPSTATNPTLPQRVVDRAMEADPEAARAEYLAEFRADLERVFSQESIAAVTSPGTVERPYAAGVRYVGFADPSGGSADSFTLCIAHKEGETVVLDAIRERRPPFSPEDVVRDFAALLKAYGVYTVRGDRYAGEWPRQAFRRHGIQYVPAGVPKSDLYRDLLPLVNAKRIDLLDVPRLAAQLVGLERRTARGGRDSIDHGPGGHDDLANAAAGASWAAQLRAPRKAVFGASILIEAPEWGLDAAEFGFR